jgi:hypothetical protein
MVHDLDPVNVWSVLVTCHGTILTGRRPAERTGAFASDVVSYH